MEDPSPASRTGLEWAPLPLGDWPCRCLCEPGALAGATPHVSTRSRELLSVKTVRSPVKGSHCRMVPPEKTEAGAEQRCERRTVSWRCRVWCSAPAAPQVQGLQHTQGEPRTCILVSELDSKWHCESLSWTPQRVSLRARVQDNGLRRGKGAHGGRRSAHHQRLSLLRVCMNLHGEESSSDVSPVCMPCPVYCPCSP